MDLQLLKTFLCVAKTENLTQTAEKMNFTQPTITAQIKSLEKHFGALLFERTGKKLHITAAGNCLIDYAEKILALDNEAKDALQNFSPNTIIRIGLGTAVATHMLAPFLQDLQRLYPDVSIQVEHCFDIPLTLEGILDNSFDFAVVHDAIKNAKIRQFPVLKQQLLWVGAPGLIKNPQESIWNYPYVSLKRGKVYRKFYEDLFHDHNIRPSLEYSDSEAVFQAALNGCGIAILPEILVADSIRHKKLYAFPTAPIREITFSIIFRKGKIFPLPVQQLLLAIAAAAPAAQGFRKYLTT